MYKERLPINYSLKAQKLPLPKYISEMQKNIEIQSLRGFAIAITIIAHFGHVVPEFDPALTYFWLGGGVDLFCRLWFRNRTGSVRSRQRKLCDLNYPILETTHHSSLAGHVLLVCGHPAAVVLL